MDSNEQILTDFMARHYSDERLSWLLAHAESGKLAYVSCCCFIGIANADHALRGEVLNGGNNPEFGLHIYAARLLQGGYRAEIAYQGLGEDEYMTDLAKAMSSGSTESAPDRDAYRRAKLIPLIEAEITRRALSRSQTEAASEMVMV